MLCSTLGPTIPHALSNCSLVRPVDAKVEKSFNGTIGIGGPKRMKCCFGSLPITVSSPKSSLFNFLQEPIASVLAFKAPVPLFMGTNDRTVMSIHSNIYQIRADCIVSLCWIRIPFVVD